MPHIFALVSLLASGFLTRGAGLMGLLPLEATAAPVYVTQGSGFAAYIVGGFFGLGILILFMIWTSRRPKRPS